MDPTTVVALAILFALGAALYSSVGHGGASAYIAAMALFSVAPETMKPTALALNLLVAGFGAWRYWRRGLTNGKLVLAFALTATPAAFIGGGIHLPAIYYKPLVGILLWLAAARLLWQPKALADREVQRAAAVGHASRGRGARAARRTDRHRRRDIPQPADHPDGLGGAAAHVGRRLGLHLPQLRCGPCRQRGVGRAPAARAADLPGAVGAGALLGTWLGVERLPRPWLLRTLGLVLIVAGAKLLFT